MVRHRGLTRFCGRNSNGKYDLDVHELRSAFVANETYADRLKSFRLDRINRLLSGQASPQMNGEHFIVLHILPVAGVAQSVKLEPSDLTDASKDHKLKPINSNGWGDEFNFDGLIVKSSNSNGLCDSYVQLMRNGFIEAVDCRILAPRSHNGGPPAKIIASIAWEQKILERFSDYLNALQAVSIPAPYCVSISFLNVRSFLMYVGPRYDSGYDRPIDRDHLLTEEILVESTSLQADQILKPHFDQIWNACGRRGSINYDQAGNWRSHE